MRGKRIGYRTCQRFLIGHGRIGDAAKMIHTVIAGSQVNKGLDLFIAGKVGTTLPAQKESIDR